MNTQAERQEKVDNISKSKPKIASAKSKPFNIRDTPKKSNDYATPNPGEEIDDHEPARPEHKSRVKSKFVSESDRSNNNLKQRPPKFDETEPKLLSNTHVFEHNNDNIETVSNENARRSMNNLHLLKDQKKKKLMQERSHKSVSKQSTKQDTRQSMKPPINNSSSQSSLSGVTGIMDLGNKKKQSQNVMKTKDEKRHETIVVQKQQKTKPLIGKNKTNIIKRHETMNTFEEESSIDPTLTTNTLVPQRMQGIDSEAPSKKSLSHLNNIRVEKQDSSSASEDADDDNESDEEEFPVALNGLVFSFLPPEIADKLNDQIDWKNRVSALQETENLIK